MKKIFALVVSGAFLLTSFSVVSAVEMKTEASKIDKDLPDLIVEEIRRYEDPDGTLSFGVVINNIGAPIGEEINMPIRMWIKECEERDDFEEKWCRTCCVFDYPGTGKGYNEGNPYFTNPNPGTFGVYTIIAYVDPDPDSGHGLIEESNETNNYLTERVRFPRSKSVNPLENILEKFPLLARLFSLPIFTRLLTI